MYLKNILAICICLSLSGCLSPRTNTKQNIGQSVESTELVDAFVNSITLNSTRITSKTPLKGKVRIKGVGEGNISGALLFEIAFVDSYQPLWVANIPLNNLQTNETEIIPFSFYNEDIAKHLNLEKANEESAFLNQSPQLTGYYFDLIIRTQNNELREPFVFFLDKD